MSSSPTPPPPPLPSQSESDAQAEEAETLAEQERTREVLSRLRPEGRPGGLLPAQEELDVLERELGRDHRETLEFLTRTGNERMEIECYADAVGFLEKAVAGYSRTRGQEHKTTKRVAKMLAKAQRLAADRKGGSCSKRIIYLLLYVPLLGSVCSGAWSYTPPWVQRGALLGGGQLLSGLHEGPCVAAGLCTPYSTQLAELYSGYYRSNRRKERQKLDAIPQLLEKWAGKEMALVAAVTEKYGISELDQT
jgi:hypothetical protein